MIEKYGKHVIIVNSQVEYILALLNCVTGANEIEIRPSVIHHPSVPPITSKNLAHAFLSVLVIGCPGPYTRTLFIFKRVFSFCFR